MAFTEIEEKDLADAVTMGADMTSAAINARTVVSFTIACIVSASASPVGNLILEVLLVTGGTYRAHTSVPITGDGVTIFEILDPSGLSYRVFYDRTSGSATLDVEIAARVHKRGGDPTNEVL